MASGTTLITGTFTPTDVASFEPAISNNLNVKIGVPVQGIVSPIHIYVDTILATGSTGPTGPGSIISGTFSKLSYSLYKLHGVI